ncbi:MAG TPA: MMPL family transporter, partial [Mycobacterium sp.]
MSNHQLHNSRLFVARTIRRLSVPIILAWLAITVLVSVGVPSLEQVERAHSVSQSPKDAPSVKALNRMVTDFKEASSESVAMVVLEGQNPLGHDAHEYYNRLIRQFQDDPTHIQHIQNFWGDPLTAGAAQSADGKAAYVQLNLTGHLGAAEGNAAAEAVRDIVARTPAPAGVKAYVTGPAAIASDMGRSGERTVILVTVVSLAVIFIMLLLVYRSIITVVLLLLMVWIELQLARGIVAFLGYHEIVGLSTYVVNLLVSIVIAAGTD